MISWNELLAAQLDQLSVSHLCRTRQAIRRLDSTHIEVDGKRLINFASNDYLGLSIHSAVTGAAQPLLHNGCFGTGASALICGYTSVHAAAEGRIARWKGTGGAVVLGSGYLANLAAVQTLSRAGEAAGGVRFLIDKLVHASIVDAVRGSGQPFRVFPHNGLEKLDRLLTEAAPDERQVVITESIFSMDGDAADLAGLVALRKRHGFFLLVDEAHGSGVYGQGGAGLAAELGLADQIDASVVTFSKAAGVFGGAVCGSKPFCDAIVNYGRAYIYATSLPASVAAGITAAVDVMAGEPQRQQRLRASARRVRQAIPHALGMVDSPIVPVVFGTEHAALSAAITLRTAGIFVQAIRPPTVPRGTSRLRITLSSDHTDDQLTQLIDAINALHPSHK